jgi:hypothetical protein
MTADLSDVCTDKRFSRARTEDCGSRHCPTDDHRSFIRQPSRGAGSGRSGAEKYEQRLALPSVPARLNTLPPNKTTTKLRPHFPIRKHRKILKRLVRCQYKALARIYNNYRWFCKINSKQGGNTRKIEVSFSELIAGKTRGEYLRGTCGVGPR